MIKTSPFSFRDTVQYVLPVAIGAGLFLPYLPGSAKLELVFPFVVLLSYSLHTPLAYAASLPVTWFKRLFVRQRRKGMRELKDDYDLDALFYRLCKEDREYLYLTGAYVEMHRKVALVFLLYALFQLFVIFPAIQGHAGNLTDRFAEALKVTTSVIGGISVNSCALLVFSLLLASSSWRDAESEDRDLIETYQQFAQRYGKDHPEISRN